MRGIFAVIFVLIFVITFGHARPFDEQNDKRQIVMEFIEIRFFEPEGLKTMMDVGGPPPREQNFGIFV
jgi:hypothetical protein